MNDAEQRDSADPLKDYRTRFLLPEGIIYLDGNSLGALPRHVKSVMEETIVNQWGSDLIRSWNAHEWITLPTRVGEKIAPIIGAGEGQVVCADSTSVNLFKLLTAALGSNDTDQQRNVIVSEQGNFPTDLYIAEGVSSLLGEDRARLRLVSDGDFDTAIDHTTAILMLTHVNFRDGSIQDLPRLTRLAHDRGALVLWDLSHSAGIVNLDLDANDVDLAVGCGYKYLNGGPGAPSFVYVNRRLQAAMQQPLSGWMGHRQPFEFSTTYEPADGIDRFLAGTPPILSMQALSAALDLYQDLDIRELRTKSVRLTEYFIEGVANIPELTLASPRDNDRRGSQVSLSHPDAYAIMQALIDRGVIGDFREPDILRFGFAPLYNSFDDTQRAIEILIDVVTNRHFDDPRFRERQRVT